MSRFRITLSTTALATALAITTAFGLSLFPWSSTAQASGEDVLYVGGDVTEPVRISGDDLAYPEDARKDRIEGPMVMQAVVDQEGQIESMEVKKSLGPTFDEAAKRALATWRFEPATLHGQAVKVYYHLTINFRLDSGQPEASEG